MRLISWNVNGLRACMKKGFEDFFTQIDADVFCLQETKLSEGQIDWAPEGYHCYWAYADKKGYSGTALFSKEEPLAVTYGMGLEEHEGEGRIICAEYGSFYVVCVYTPNSKRGLERLDYRCEWEDAFRGYLSKLGEKKPVIVCGDLNVAHREIDLKNPSSNHQNAGFTDRERAKMDELLASGFTDSFRYMYPDAAGRYSWWSYMFHARENNAGWRIDYFLVGDSIREKIKDAMIYDAVTGSDHCPVGLLIEL